MDSNDDDLINSSDDDVINISDEELFPHDADDAININDEELFPPEVADGNVGHDEEVMHEKKRIKRIIIRGPGYEGDDESFDKHCVFGNEVEMNLNQAMLLTSYVEDLPIPKVKQYVRRMTNQFVMPVEGKMEFTKEYTKKYLMKFLVDHQSMRYGVPSRPRDICVAVMTKGSSVKNYCTMTLSPDGNACITIGWPYAVRAFDLQEGDICIFTFTDESHLPARRKDPFASMKMEIFKLEESHRSRS